MPTYSRQPQYKKKIYAKKFTQSVSKNSLYKNAKIARNPPRFGMPETYITKLRYSQRYANGTPGFGVGNVTNFGANCLFDPDLTTVAGHQPRFFEQMMALYSHYTVIGAKISVQCTTDNVSSFDVRVMSQLNASTPTMNAFNESNYAVAASFTRDNTMKPITLYQNIAKFLGVGDIRSFSPARGSFTTNPADRTVFSVIVGNSDISDGSLHTYTMLVTIDYTVIFGEPIMPGQSS